MSKASKVTDHDKTIVDAIRVCRPDGSELLLSDEAAYELQAQYRERIERETREETAQMLLHMAKIRGPKHLGYSSLCNAAQEVRNPSEIRALGGTDAKR